MAGRAVPARRSVGRGQPSVRFKGSVAHQPVKRRRRESGDFGHPLHRGKDASAPASSNDELGCGPKAERPKLESS